MRELLLLLVDCYVVIGASRPEGGEPVDDE